MKNRKLKLVVNNIKDVKKEKTILTHTELMTKINNTGGTYIDREQVVIEHLRSMGL